MQKPQKNIEVVNVRLPDDTIVILDTLVKKNVFSSRSEAIREFSRQYVLENK